MVTKLDRPVRREVRIGQKPYVITITPDRLRVVVKGRRKGRELLWEDLVGEHGGGHGDPLLSAPRADSRLRPESPPHGAA